MKIGVDYYPEHWDKALWRADADLMQQHREGKTLHCKALREHYLLSSA